MSIVFKRPFFTEYNSTQSHVLYKVAKFSSSNIPLCPVGLNTLAACSSAPWHYVQFQTCSSSKCHIPSSQWETRCQQVTAMLSNLQWRARDVWWAGAKKIKWAPVCKKSCWEDTLSYLVHCKGSRDGTLSCFIFHWDVALCPPCALFTSRPPQPPQFNLQLDEIVHKYHKSLLLFHHAIVIKSHFNCVWAFLSYHQLPVIYQLCSISYKLANYS